ncbi:MAG: hypothetical protein ACRDHM_09730 [Actinomycetota bacterium]
MERARKQWIRGAVVIGVAGAMMAVALLSPALAVKLATTGYVKQKVNAVQNVALTALRTPDYSQSPVQVVPAGTFGTIEGSCGVNHVVSGGASDGGSDAISIFESYPSDGNFATANVTGRNGWAVTIGNFAATPVNVYAYKICAVTSISSGNVGGTARSAGSQKPGWSFTPIGRLSSASR